MHSRRHLPGQSKRRSIVAMTRVRIVATSILAIVDPSLSSADEAPASTTALKEGGASASSERSLDEMLRYTARRLGPLHEVNGGPNSPKPGEKCTHGSTTNPCTYITEPSHFSVLKNAYAPYLGTGVHPSLDINPFKVMASFDLDRVLKQAAKMLEAEHKIAFAGRSATSVLVTTMPEPISKDTSAHYQVFAQLTTGCDESEITFMDCGFYMSADRIVFSVREKAIPKFGRDDLTVRLESMILDEIQIAMSKE